ncbi:hypothetical protein EYF80_024551 [Liparis tanakae]|uniref:Uncharacterized protein n=1 Tax=Liparis tanakae TaxID=230148 RepID=A0A4Z2HK69_9TELE|nr:hypothetical protein EYF80_024551 [Liparis tanakae]
MSQCHVCMVRATISSSVRMRAVKEMATAWTNSESKSSNAPYMMMPPGGKRGHGNIKRWDPRSGPRVDAQSEKDRPSGQPQNGQVAAAVGVNARHVVKGLLKTPESTGSDSWAVPPWRGLRLATVLAVGLSEPSESGYIGSKPQRDTGTRAP